MPRKQAATWVSKITAGLVPHAWSRTSRSWSAACSTARPGPSNTVGQRAEVDGQRIDEGELVRPPGDLEERQARVVGALAVELGVERVAGRLAAARRRRPRGGRRRRSDRRPGSPGFAAGHDRAARLDPGAASRRSRWPRRGRPRRGTRRPVGSAHRPGRSRGADRRRAPRRAGRAARGAGSAPRRRRAPFSYSSGVRTSSTAAPSASRRSSSAMSIWGMSTHTPRSRAPPGRSRARRRSG